MQRELSQISQTNGQQGQELKDLRRRQKSDEESMAVLRREIAEKKRSSAASQERVKQLEIGRNPKPFIDFLFR